MNHRTAGSRTLVLGGGGITGIAWELGILKGLADHGVDVTDADTVIGTSAGSVVGAQITSGAPLDDLYDALLTPADHEIGATMGIAAMAHWGLLYVLPGDGRTKRRRIARAALRKHPESADGRLGVISSRLGARAWPDRDLRITAVQVETGSFTVFDRDSGVELVHAVAASCAVPLIWPPVPIDGRRYVDGGVRSTANADLAEGADRVVVIAPLPRSASAVHAIPAQLERARARHSAIVVPSAAALEAIGRNVLDPAKRADAARAGLEQAAAVADHVRGAWTAVPR